MPIYEYQCPGCDLVKDVERFMSQRNDPLICSKCGATMDRAYLTPPMIQGDTVSGGVNYQYYDETLGKFLRGKQHRREEMKKQGFEEYSPDPAMKKYRDENGYIRKNARKGDVQANQEIQKNTIAASKERAQRNSSAVIDAATKRIKKELGNE